MFNYHSLIPWESFQGRQEEKWGSFRGRFGDHFRAGDHFRVGIILGAVQYFAINEILFTAKYSVYTIIESEYFAVNEILLTAKYLLYIRLSVFTAKYFRSL